MRFIPGSHLLGHLTYTLSAIDETNVLNQTKPGNGSGRNRMALATLKIAVFAPMPSASTRIDADANAGFLRITRSACRKSRKKPSMMVVIRMSLHSSWIWETPPSTRKAASRASPADIPAARFSAICSSRWKDNSSASSRSTRERRNSERSRKRSCWSALLGRAICRRPKLSNIKSVRKLRGQQLP